MGAVPPFLGTPEDCLELNGQFLRFREMVKLTRIGETHQLKPLVVCIERRVEEPIESDGTNEMT